MEFYRKEYFLPIQSLQGKMFPLGGVVVSFMIKLGVFCFMIFCSVGMGADRVEYSTNCEKIKLAPGDFYINFNSLPKEGMTQKDITWSIYRNSEEVSLLDLQAKVNIVKEFKEIENGGKIFTIEFEFKSKSTPLSRQLGSGGIATTRMFISHNAEVRTFCTALKK